MFFEYVDDPAMNPMTKPRDFSEIFLQLVIPTVHYETGAAEECNRVVLHPQTMMKLVKGVMAKRGRQFQAPSAGWMKAVLGVCREFQLLVPLDDFYRSQCAGQRVGGEAGYGCAWSA